MDNSMILESLEILVDTFYACLSVFDVSIERQIVAFRVSNYIYLPQYVTLHFNCIESDFFILFLLVVIHVALDIS